MQYANIRFLKHFLVLLLALTVIFITYIIMRNQNVTEVKPKDQKLRNQNSTKAEPKEQNITYSKNTEPNYIVNKSSTEKKDKVYTLSFYTIFYEKVKEWSFFQTKTDYMKECGYALRNCRYDYDKSNWRNSDLVFFHGRILEPQKRKELEKMKKLSKPGQLWVYFIMEPTVLTYNHEQFNHLFELVASYRRMSDMFSPYGQYEALTPEEKLKASKIQKNYAQGKSKQIYWIVSHCGMPREKLVDLLIKNGLEIDVGGKCKGKYKRQLSEDTLKKEQNLKEYKFYLSFENSFCTDYISEKYWYTPLIHGNIPIVLGGANYDRTVAVPGSFINALDFKSPKDLAEYIKKVASNDTLYNQYFEWKNHYKVYSNYFHSNGCAKSMDLFCQKLHTGAVNPRKNALLNDINKARECDQQLNRFYDWVNVTSK